MFRKLIANLSFSPALINEVGFYARRLRKEEATRRLTLIFMALALVVQSLAIFSPPESANASNEQDLLRGGVTSKDDLLTRYRVNEANVKDILSAAGITEAELERAEAGTISSKDNAFVSGRLSRFGTSEGEAILTYKRSDTGQEATIYLSPLNLLDTDEISQSFGTSYQGWIGQSEKLGWFGILKDSGNIVTKTLPEVAIRSSTELSRELITRNISQGNIAADSVAAEPGDRISYTITAHNSSSKSQLTPLAVTLDDVLEYAALIDQGGALFEEKAKTLSWSPVVLTPGQTEQRTFVIQLLDPLPATPQGTSNNMSYDCVLTSSYGTTSRIHINCPASKNLESTLALFPTIGATGSMIFGIVVGGLIAFFYLRARQMKEEIRLIRHNLNEGTL